MPSIGTQTMLGLPAASVAGELVLAAAGIDDERVHRLGDQALVEGELRRRAADLRGQPLRARAVRRPARVVIHREPLLEREHGADDRAAVHLERAAEDQVLAPTRSA